MPTSAKVAVMAVITILLLPLAGVLIDRPPIRYLNQPFPVEEPVMAGKPARIQVQRCSDNSEPVLAPFARNLYYLDSNLVISLPSGSILIEPGCHLITDVNVEIPSNTVPGRYILKGGVEVRGRFRDFTVVWESAPFTVVPVDSLD